MSDSLGKRIRELRLKKEWSQDYLAMRSGYKSRAAISRIERDEVRVSAEKIQKFAEVFGVSPLYLMQDSFQKGDLRVVKIPVLGRIPAGIPIEAITDIEDYEEMYDMPGEYFALRVKGDSMVPRIQPDSIVIFRKAEDCESGQICAVMVNGDDATLKKVVKSEAGIMLMPLNSAYEPRFFSNDEIAKLPVRILGVAIEVRCKL